MAPEGTPESRRIAARFDAHDKVMGRLREAVMDGLVPLEHLDETLLHDGAQWVHEAPGGTSWVIRWFSNSGNVTAWRFPRRQERPHRGSADDLEAARREVLRIVSVTDGGGA